MFTAAPSHLLHTLCSVGDWVNEQCQKKSENPLFWSPSPLFTIEEMGSVTKLKLKITTLTQDSNPRERGPGLLIFVVFRVLCRALVTGFLLTVKIIRERLPSQCDSVIEVNL